MTQSNTERLQEKIDLVLHQLIDASTELVMHPRFSELFPELMVSMHWMVRSTVPLMRTALKRCEEIADKDAVARALIPYFRQHIKEEMHHDEWALQDLELLGYRREDVLRRVPSPSAAASVGSRYYWILHHHPIAEMGGIAVMEGYPPSVEAMEFMIERSGLTRQAFRTLEKHVHLDPKHRDDMLEAIDGLPMQEEHHQMLGVSALYTIETVSALYRETTQRIPSEATDIPVAC